MRPDQRFGSSAASPYQTIPHYPLSFTLDFGHWTHQLFRGKFILQFHVSRLIYRHAFHRQCH